MERKGIIAFVSGKGGAGKTVIIANLGAMIARHRRILMVDCDFSTRGLTFYVIGEEAAETGYLDFFETALLRPYRREAVDRLISDLEKDIKGYNHLHLLPASSTTELYSISDLEKILRAIDEKSTEDTTRRLLKRIHGKLRKLFLQLAESFDYILVDTRSGADPLCLLPALASEEFILVAEEDKTSWRTGGRLINVIKNLGKELRIRHRVRFKGFILNKVTEGIPEEYIQDFLEKRIVGGHCLLQIPLERAVPLAFKEDKLVVDESPNSTFSEKMGVLRDIIYGFAKKEILKKSVRETILEFYGSSELVLLFVSISMLLLAMVIQPELPDLFRGFYSGVMIATLVSSLSILIYRIIRRILRR